MSLSTDIIIVGGVALALFLFRKQIADAFSNFGKSTITFVNNPFGVLTPPGVTSNLNLAQNISNYTTIRPNPLNPISQTPSKPGISGGIKLMDLQGNTYVYSTYRGN